MIDSYQDHRQIILKLLNEKRSKNPGFSLRALSRLLKISPGQLSQVISGKRPFTLKVAVKLSNYLNLSPQEKNQLLNLAHTAVTKPPFDVRVLEEDEFKTIAEWYHFAILSLGELKNNSNDIRWIAKRLNINILVVREAFERLKRLGLIKISNGQFRQASKPLRTTSNKASIAIRRHHKANLQLASEKIDSVEISQREYTSMTMAVDPKKIQRAKVLINQFKEDICQLLETGNRTEVYTLALQLFPLTEGEGK